MTTAIHYCLIHKTHHNPEPPKHICTNCETTLKTWLEQIPTNYALLPRFKEHGTTDRNPDAKTTKSAQAPTPLRLDIIDLLDERHGRKWLGTTPTNDRRGTLGTLLAIATEIAETRGLPGNIPNHVYGAADYIDKNTDWLTTQEWVTEPFHELRKLHRRISDAVGIYRPKPVGTCHLINDDTTTPCGGPLMANPYGGVKCLRCRATWDANHLRQLGLAQAQETA